jgi:expansin (peptidoglycan-binding protein)
MNEPSGIKVIKMSTEVELHISGAKDLIPTKFTSIYKMNDSRDSVEMKCLRLRLTGHNIEWRILSSGI